MTQDFEKAFGDFIDRHEYDEAQGALFSMIRISFKAGWLAAAERNSKAQKVIEMPRVQPEVQPETKDN